MNDSVKRQWEHGKAWVFKGLEFLVCSLFLWALFRQESAVLQIMAEPHGDPVAEGIRDFLGSMLPGWFPDRFWHLAWPFACAGAGFVFWTRWRWYVLAGLGFGSGLILLADRLYFQFFGSVVSAGDLMAAAQLWDVRHSLGNTLSPRDLLPAASFLLFAAYGYAHNRLTQGRPSGTFWWLIADKAWGLLLFLMGFWAFTLGFYVPTRSVVLDLDNRLTIVDEIPKSGDRYVPRYESSHKDFATTFGLFNFHLRDVTGALAHAFSRDGLSSEEMGDLTAFLQQKQALNRVDSPFRGLARDRNVFLISLESFQHFLWELELDGMAVTPHLNRLRNEGLFFDYIIDQSKAGGTADAEFSIMTGLLPDIRKIASLTTPAKNTLHALPKTLKRKGYGTFSLHAYRASFWNRNVNHPRYGIDRLFFEKTFSGEDRIGLGTPDHLFLQEALAILQQQPAPFFAFLVCLSSHHPYLNVPESHRGLFPSLPAGTEATRYLQLARYTDEALGAFFEALRQTDLWENSLFVIYGDHIAPLGEEARRQIKRHTGVGVRAVRHMRVPFLILAPGKESFIQAHRGEFSRVLGGLQDVYPTVLHLLDVEAPLGLFGTHLFVPNQRRDPIPHLKKSGGFYDRGAYYLEGTEGQWRDSEGPVFWEVPADEQWAGKAQAERYQQAMRAIFFHFMLFDADAQKKIAAISARP